jgi:hypothetical protein
MTQTSAVQTAQPIGGTVACLWRYKVWVGAQARPTYTIVHDVAPKYEYSLLMMLSDRLSELCKLWAALARRA